MDEPTDRSLRLQGLKRTEYDSLSAEGKAVVAGRGRRLAELSNITLVAELLTTLAEADDTGRQYVAEVIDGRRPEFETKVREIVREYLDANVDISVRDYYKVKYGGKPAIEETPKQPAEAPAQPPPEQQPQATDTPKPAAAPAPEPPSAPPEPPKPAAGEKPAAPNPPQDAATARRLAIAATLSRREKRSVESVMKTEQDIITGVMSVADENADTGMTDETVYKACETIIEDKISGIQYFREALIPENREKLLSVAKLLAKQ
jgi:outer membrane biosynthesis protein TonB